MAVASSGRPQRRLDVLARYAVWAVGSSRLGWANTLTLARLLSALPLAIAFQAGLYDWAAIIFILAALTDAVDGWVARRTCNVSRLGAILDPLADKLVVAMALIGTALAGILPIWLAVSIVVRDIFLGIGFVLLRRARRVDRDPVPSLVGKSATATLLCLLAIALVDAAHWLHLAWLLPSLTVLAAGLLCMASWHYCQRALTGPPVRQRAGYEETKA